MQVAKYWRNNKLRYRLIRSAVSADRRLDVKRKSNNSHPNTLSREAALKTETA